MARHRLAAMAVLLLAVAGCRDAPPEPTAATTPAAMPVPAPAALPAVAAPRPAPLLLPVQGVAPESLLDSYDQRRGGARHEAIDIPAPRGTPVHAVADGRVVKLFTSKPGGLTVYQFSADERLAYYYAHLDRYAPDLAEGQMLARGDPIGAVGSTGNASPDAPHLHFAIFVLGPERQWWRGSPINPYPLLTAAR